LEAGKEHTVSELSKLQLIHEEGSTILRRDLNKVMAATQFTSVLLLADTTDGGTAAETDSRTLTTMLLVRDIQHRKEKRAIEERARREVT
jgi:hypothetical protein